MKVIDKIRKAEEEGRVYWSFEYFPPKTAQVRPPPNKKNIWMCLIFLLMLFFDRVLKIYLTVLDE